ncbi:hypothetical protein O23A_p1251 [Aeromonas salmonicida]|nr:hypothetical protein O23A_p1251 [Aeromonas salmonicida]
MLLLLRGWCRPSRMYRRSILTAPQMNWHKHRTVLKFRPMTNLTTQHS